MKVFVQYIVCLMFRKLRENLQKQKCYSHFRNIDASITRGHKDLIFWILSFSQRLVSVPNFIKIWQGHFHFLSKSVSLQTGLILLPYLRWRTFRYCFARATYVFGMCWVSPMIRTFIDFNLSNMNSTRISLFMDLWFIWPHI
jgi:hypothetical protein